MRSIVAVFAALSVAFAAPAAAQRKSAPEMDVALQRASVEAWTACIAREFPREAGDVLARDFNSTEYKIAIKQLAQTRVSKSCFDAMPRDYRKIRLGGLPFAGGLAEHMLEADREPLLKRLSMAALGDAPPSLSRTDGIATCMARGAPDVVAALFASQIESEEERAVLAKLQPVADICAGQGPRLEASALGMRSMLATAAYRLLAAKKGSPDA